MNTAIATTLFQLNADLFPLTAAILASVACGVLGNFLVLRKLALMGDAISHAVLPGLVIAFLITTSRSPLIMFAGAAAAALLTVVLVEAVKKLGKVEPGAAMGVVFSVLFALGVLLIERAAVRHVDLDADCVLHGNLSFIGYGTTPETWNELLSPDALHAIPRQVWTLLAAAAAIAATAALFKELRVAAFDPLFAGAVGLKPNALHYLLMTLVAAATVASFEAVGSILVIAMLVCPAATARLLTERLHTQITASVIIAAATATLGYFAATAVPAALGLDAVNAAGSIVAVAGLALAAATLASPSHGLIARSIRARRLARTVHTEDLIAALYRLRENRHPHPTIQTIQAQLPHLNANATAKRAERQSLAEAPTPNTLRLTERGLRRAQNLVRRHRLWEAYLVEQAGLAPDHVHPTAHTLEHLPRAPDTAPQTDPHGSPIPPPPQTPKTPKTPS